MPGFKVDTPIGALKRRLSQDEEHLTKIKAMLLKEDLEDMQEVLPKIKKNTTDIVTETNRAISKETEHKTLINKNTGDITAEVNRAKQVENTLTSLIDSNATVLAGEATTARAAEKSNADAIKNLSNIVAPKDSPVFTGIPLVPTASSDTNNQQIASTEFVKKQVSQLVNDAPKVLDTLNEIAVALNNDGNYAESVTTAIAAEASTARAAEKSNSDALAAEASTARAAEKSNSDACS